LAKIDIVKAREVLDSRGNPTVEVDVRVGKHLGRAIVPSGASTGIHEALELRDKTKRYLKKGVQKAVGNVNDVLSKKVIGMDIHDQHGIDKVMIDLDGTKNKSKLGANAILGVSMAAARAGALVNDDALYLYLARLFGNKRMTLPVPFSNVINGGEHAGNDLAIQEFMIVPVGARNFARAVQMVSETYHVLKGLLKKKYGKLSVNVGDEGGFAPPLDDARKALNILMKAVSIAGYEKKIKIAIDAAASEFYNRGIYCLKRQFNADMLVNYYHELVKKYPIVSLEDPFAEDDFEAYSKFMKKARIQVIGDDLLVTNVERIRMAHEMKLCNSLLLKVNQIGTLTEAMAAAKLAYRYGWTVVVSHRSGETEDSFISDLAVGLGCGQIKLGAPCRSERTAKYNQLIRIEEELGKKAKFSRVLK